MEITSTNLSAFLHSLSNEQRQKVCKQLSAEFGGEFLVEKIVRSYVSTNLCFQWKASETTYVHLQYIVKAYINGYVQSWIDRK